MIPSPFDRWLTPPTFADEEKNRLAGQQYAILWGTIAIALIFGLLTLMLQPSPWPRLLLTGLWLPVALGSLVLLRRGTVKLAGLLYASLAWLILTIDAWLAGGVMSAGFSSYTVIIVVIGMLAGLRVALVFAGLSFAMGGALLYADSNGILPVTSLVTTPLSLWLALTTNFVVAAVLVYLATGSISNVLKQTRANEAALLTSNRQLQAAQQTLQERTSDLSTAVDMLELQLTERKQIVEALRQSEQELRQLNLELEQRVHDRTRELAETNAALSQEVAIRQQAELSLQETLALIEHAKQEWEVTVDSAPQFIGLLDREGRLKRANRTVERWNLAPVTQVKGQTVHHLFHPNCTDPACPIENFWRQASQKLHQGQLWQGETDDKILGRYLQWQVEPIAPPPPDRQQPSDTWGVVVVQDITARKQAEKALRESQQRLELAISGTGGALWDEILDPEATFEELAGTTYLSPEAKSLLGYDDAKANDLPDSMSVWDSHVLPEDQAQRVKNQRDHFEGRTEVLDHEYRIRRLDGAVRWIQGRSRIIRDEQGRPIRWIGIDWDVTERKRAEEDLRKLSRAVEQSPSTVVITDQQGRIEFVNPRFTQITGYGWDEVIGQNPRLLKSGQHRPEFYQEIWQTILAGQVWRGELVNRTRNGELYWELASISPVRDDEGRITHFIKVAEDITNRKQAEEALRESEAKFRSYIEFAPVAVFVSDGTGRYVEANQVALDMLGYAAAALYEKHIPEIVPEEDHTELFGAEAALRRVGYYEGELRQQRQDGQQIWISLRAVKITDDRFMAFCHDITARKQAEKALRESEARYRLLAENMVDVVWTMSPTGQFTYVSPSVERLRGYTVPEVLAQTPAQALTPASLQIMQAALMATMPQIEQGAQHFRLEPATYELEQPRKDGSTVWTEVLVKVLFDNHGNFSGFLGVSRDISERKRTELELARYRDHLEELVNERTAQLNQANQKLQQSEENFRALADNAQDGFAIISGAEQLVYVNPRACQLTGYSAAELLNRTVKDLVPVAEYETVSQRYHQRLAGEAVINQYQTALAHKSGRWVPVELTAARTTWYGRPAIVVSFRDITERKQAEAALKQRHQELLALQRASAAISSSLDLDYVLETVTREMASLLNIESCHFSRWDQSRNTLRKLAGYAPAGWQGDEPEPEVYDLNDYPLTQQVLAARQPVQLTIGQPDIDSAELAYMQSGHIKTLLMLPMVYQDQTIGLVDLEDSRFERTFSEHELKLAQTLSDQAAVAIQNARLYEQARQEIAERERVQADLERSEAQFRQVITSISDHIYVTEITATGEHRNQYISPNVEILTGYSPDRFLVDWAFWSEHVIYPADRAAAAEQFVKFEQGQPSETEYRLNRADGQVIWVRDSGRVELRNGTKIVYGVVNDITARKEAEETILRYSERLEILREIEQGILSAQSVEAIGRVVVSRIRRVIPCSRVSIRILNEAATEVVMASGYDETTGLLPPGDLIRLDQLNVPREWFEPLRAGQVLVLEEAQLNQIEASTAHPGRASVMIVPLIYQAELVGTLNLSATKFGAFSPEHQAVAQQIADQLAIAMRQTQLYEQVQRHAEELEQRVTDRTRELSALYEVAAVASQVMELPAMLAQALRQVLTALQSSVGLIWLSETGTDQPFRLVAQQGLAADEVGQVETGVTTAGLLGQVVGQNHPLLLPSLAADPRLIGTGLPAGLRTFAGAPIRVAGQLLGALTIFGRLEKQFNVEDMALLSTVADQIGVAVENIRLRQQAREAAVVAERERLARELHDSVTQSLYSLTLFAEGALEQVRSGQLEPVQHNLTRIGETAQQALKEMRLLVYELRPIDLAQEGLVGALHQRLAAVERRAGITARLVTEDLIELPLALEQELYGITQEALNNTLKHSGATLVTVHLRLVADEVELAILDNGQGFDPDEVQGKGGLGLRGLRERVAKVQGVLTIRSAPGKGTIIEVRVKVPK